MVVVNLRFAPYDVYIGRGKDGYFGNPFKLGGREEVRRQFTEWFYRRVEIDAEYAQRVLGLRGKRCGCFCAPLYCHGDTMASWVKNAKCCMCQAEATIAVDLDDRVLLLCGECGK